MAPPEPPRAARALAVSREVADLFFCLAAAFMLPPAAMSARQWVRTLAVDLDELGRALGLDTVSAVGALEELARAPDEGGPWLVEYSRLFLVPPVKVTLNAGVYLEGGLAGSSAQMMSQCYAIAGFALRESFHDLPDHVAVQLEFVGVLLDRAAAGDPEGADMASEFITSFVQHWADPLVSACNRVGDDDTAARAYASLAFLIRSAAGSVTG